MNKFERSHNKLIEIFQNSCRANFQFLTDEFGFGQKKPDVMPVGNSLLFVNSKAGVEINFDRRENCISIYLVQLDEEQVPRYLDHPEKWVLLDEVLSVRNVKIDIEEKPFGEWLTKSEIRHIVEKLANGLKKHCADILKGDFTIFMDVMKQRNERVNERVRTEWH